MNETPPKLADVLAIERTRMAEQVTRGRHARS